MRSRSRSTAAALLLAPWIVLAIYAGAYGWARGSGRLVTFDACDSVWPCPVAIIGLPMWRAAFAPAIAIETHARRWLER